MKSNKPPVNLCDCHGTDFKPLSRDSFRELALIRDLNKCIFCDETENLSVHHIVERRLFETCQGYHLDNAATVCEAHHLLCEQTNISCEEVREKANILKTVITGDMYPDHIYDKWGNVVLLNGSRLIGPLFYDESVQKILLSGSVLNQFTPYYKYPRTVHHPYSDSITEDDRTLKDTTHFEDKEIVITIKADGENFTGYNDYCHARSIDSLNHESRNWAKQFHFSIAHDIPEGFRYCAENLYAKHSIHYTNLKSYIYGFQMWNKDICLSWDETLEWFELLGIEPVEEVYRGFYSDKIVKDLFDNLDKTKEEGLVIRLASEFKYKDFKKSVAKLVRKDHIADGSNHWRFKRITPNELKGN